MTDQSTRSADDPTAEFLASTGLVTMLAAVVAGVISVVTLGDGHITTAGILGAVALVSFVLSVFCFAADSNRSEDAALPFPSWLRTEPETAMELG